MGRTSFPLELVALESPTPFARYRPAVGPLAASLAGLGVMLGIGHLVDIASLRGLDAHRQARADVAARLQGLESEANGGPFSTDQKTEFEELVKSAGALDDIVDELEIRAQAMTSIVGGDARDARSTEGPFAGINMPNARRSPDNVYDLAAYRQRAGSVDDLPALYRDGAMRVIERASFPTSRDADRARAHLEALLAKHRFEGNGAVARRIIATDDPLYREAIAAYIAGGQAGLSPRHLAVLQTGVDVDGGFAIPFTIDPTFIITTDGAASNLRDISRVETITTKSWHPLTPADGDASYGTETAATVDSAPSDIDDLTGVTPVRAKRFIKFSAEFQEDYGPAAILAQVGALIRDSKDRLEALKFVQGSGVGEPEGIIFRLDADGTSLVPSATFDLDALDSVTGSLGPRFRVQGRTNYAANITILQKIRQLGTAGAPANSIYDQISGVLNGYPAQELSHMDDTWIAGKEVLLFGDFKTGFVIVDRIGLAVEFVPQVFDGSGDPLGQRGVYARWRNTSKVITVHAFRLLKHA